LFSIIIIIIIICYFHTLVEMCSINNAILWIISIIHFIISFSYNTRRAVPVTCSLFDIICSVDNNTAKWKSRLWNNINFKDLYAPSLLISWLLSVGDLLSYNIRDASWENLNRVNTRRRSTCIVLPKTGRSF
jgi:hypothetical protein